jgi:cytoskeletal protein CcmA (bactofilin family)
MFTKKPERTDRVGVVEVVQPGPVPSPTIGAYSNSWSANAGRGDKMGPSVIGSDLVIVGNLESKGEVTVEGQIQGDIHCAVLVVGETAQVTGGIVAEEVVVRGRVMGSVRGNKVTLQSTAHVEGDVFHKALAIEQGAFFEGKSRRADDPMGGAVGRQDGPSASNGNGLIGLPPAGGSMPN